MSLPGRIFRLLVLHPFASSLSFLPANETMCKLLLGLGRLGLAPKTGVAKNNNVQPLCPCNILDLDPLAFSESAPGRPGSPRRNIQDLCPPLHHSVTCFQKHSISTDSFLRQALQRSWAFCQGVGRKGRSIGAAREES